MATLYRKTWWGHQWLNSLSKIDNSNRLQRGRTYANNRAFKIGKTKNLMVYCLINYGTMEEKIDEMIHSKRDLADMSNTTGET